MAGNFDLRRLRYFVAVAEMRSLTRAAEVLHIAQPALSHHVRALEAELGLELFERGPRGVSLTEAGKRLFDEGRQALNGLRTMVERVREGSPTVEGEVVVGMGQTIGSLLGVPMIEAVRRQLPHVRIQLREMMSGLLPELVRSKGVDFALSYNIADGDGVVATDILVESMCVVGQRRLLDALLGSSRATTISLEAASRLPLVLSRRSHAIREQIEAVARQRKVPLSISAEIDSLYIMKDLVLQGVGCGVFSMANVYRELKHHDLRVLPISRPAIRRQVCLVRRQGLVMTRAVREVADIAVDTLLAMVADGVWPATPCWKPGAM